MPQRVQLRRTKGWRMPPNTVRVCRPTRWGNPYRVWRDAEGKWRVSWNNRCHWEIGNKAECLRFAVEMFRLDGEKSLKSYGGTKLLLELKGKNLACWCPLDQPCHADVLLELANA